MKKNLKAFTLAETLMVIMIIGVIAALTIPSIGSKVDKNKGLFKKAYSTTERTVAELVNDETYYSGYSDENFGFKDTYDVKIVGTDYYTRTTNYSNPAKTKTTTKNAVNMVVKFCNLFSNNMNTNGNPVFNGNATNSTNCTFTTNDGVDWTIFESTTPVSGFLIKIDTNGAKNPNKPATVNNVSEKKDGNAGNRDIFYFYVRYDGKMQLPEDDTIAKEYLKSSDLNKKEKEQQKNKSKKIIN